MSKHTVWHKRLARVRVDDAFLVSTKRAAELIGVSVKTLRLLGHTGDVPGMVRLGPRMIRWSVEALQTWIRKRGAAKKHNRRDRRDCS
jgi:predicted DNA-binding transcriptional regulator AlpA